MARSAPPGSIPNIMSASDQINHLQQAIRLLNERLRNSSQVISDTTIAAVASLALLEVGTLTVSLETRLPILSINQ